MASDIPIWRIKYLPKTLEEVCGRENIKEELNYFIKSNNFPHLLFIGPEGSGKSTIAKLFSKKFLGNLFQPNFKLIYADVPLTSEERKQAKSESYFSTSKIGSLAGKRITTPAFLQVKVKPFIELKVFGGAPFKILVIKNFEALGSNQQGFRRLMESYGNNCRMILLSTKISSVIDPIISRCKIMIIPSVSYHSFESLIRYIADEESLNIEDEIIEMIYRVSKGRISKAVDLLQLSSLKSKRIDLVSLYNNLISSQKDLIRSLLLLCLKGDFNKARDLSRKIQSDYRYSPHDIFSLMLSELLKLPLSTFSRSQLINLIAEADFRTLDGLDGDIQISNLLAKICHYSEFLKV